MAMEDGNNVNLLEQQHPLLNIVVLKKLFEYMKPNASMDTLKSIRQVCTVWRDESFGWWRETAVLNLTPEMLKDRKLSKMTQLLEEKPFHKFKLKDTTVNMLTALADENFQANRFWTIVGPHVKSLTLEGVKFTCGLSRDREIALANLMLMEFLIGLLPNLNTLMVKECTVNGRRFDLMVGVYERFQHPGVVSLTCSTFNYFAFVNFPNLQHLAVDDLDTLIGMKGGKHGDDVNLKHLDIILPEGETLRKEDGTLDNLRSVKYPFLERLSVDYRHKRHSSGFKFLPVFLKNHCEKLKMLEVAYFPYVRSYSNFPFGSQLDQLTELRLWGNVVEDLSFLKWTPKLKVLHMDPYGFEKHEVCNRNALKSSTDFEGDYVVRTLRKAKGTMAGLVLDDLEYLQISCSLLPPEKSFKTLGEWMPNLKTLRTVLEPGFLAVICDQWPLLEHLVGTHGSVLKDRDISGNKGLGKKGLVDFAELKTFHLNAACDEGRLTDNAVLPGFLKMKLTDFQVCVSNKFSVEAEELLKERFWKAVVIRNYSGNQEHKNWKCCKVNDFIDFLDGLLVESEDSSGSNTTSEDDWDSDDSDSWEDVDEEEGDGGCKLC